MTALIVKDIKGRRRIAAEELPIRLGNRPDAGVQVPVEGTGRVYALIGEASGAIFLQPEPDQLVRVNDKTVTESTWLQDGDIIEVDGVAVYCNVSQGMMTLAAQAPGVYQSIQPSAFRNKLPGSNKPLPIGKYFLVTLLGLTFLAGLALAAFMFFSKRVTLVTSPSVNNLKVQGGLLKFKTGDSWLMWPGTYKIFGQKKGYASLQSDFSVASDKKEQRFDFTLSELPGVASISTSPVQGGALQLDGEAKGTIPAEDIELERGEHLLQITTDRYLDLATSITVNGYGETQQFDFALTPGWAEISLNSTQSEVQLRLDGKSVGSLPQMLELFPGEYTLEVTKPEFRTWSTQIVVQANQSISFSNVELLPALAVLNLGSQPSGAAITLNGNYIGETPIQIEVEPKVDLQFAFALAGYQPHVQTVRYAPGDMEALKVELKPQEAVLNLLVEPEDAELWVNGVKIGPAKGSHTVPALPIDLEFRREGYESHTVRAVPRVGFPVNVEVVLKSLAGPPPGSAESVKAAPDEIAFQTRYRLKKIQPSLFLMGSSRREPGRRSNETLREVNLQRAFYMGVHEVDNALFALFRTTHNSGEFSGQSLKGIKSPVANLRWEEAAAFCNWMSQQAGLPAAYEKLPDGSLVAVSPMNNGFRLPTEAEWEYCARFKDKDTLLRFPWGDVMPPTGKAGNFADASAARILSPVLKDYNDGQAVSATVGSYDPNALKLYDMGGNVSEWCHDWYTIPNGSKIETDPMGPSEPLKHHVIRGSSWAQGTVGELRLTYRDYGNQPRRDVGFRVARYVD